MQPHQTDFSIFTANVILCFFNNKKYKKIETFFVLALPFSVKIVYNIGINH